ncbi:MAG: type II toxin-antitoxin system RelE/ParE family toxin [Candidatus Omnitrophica bacterium]|nr:type II toxin-antitoxin system RelE/ParE family toxin [Candidatus Omnitrophota bacterium]MBU1127839.1 type II toxin-antitoxin system RelE/ParE family toxin [Candidatus Omnitrophota bacterium]MBU1784853.1 type II toxin-antitoxin system RelE/ParE family toxin [Candidatus Omnitrophota bacterium]MBU1851822.1 type II toxin-antitoxin system RelE/ParE family toxin [Candidatus Omnitrophota bacterium]
MIGYDFTRQAARTFLKLPKSVQRKILLKIEHYLRQPNPLIFAKRITGSPDASYRFQVGDYRVIFDWESNGILITKAGHRREVYRK